MKTQTFIDALDIMTRNVEIALVEVYNRIRSGASREQENNVILRAIGLGTKYVSVLQLGERHIPTIKNDIKKVTRQLAEIQYYSQKKDYNKVRNLCDALCLTIAEIQKKFQEQLLLSPTPHLATLERVKLR